MKQSNITKLSNIISIILIGVGLLRYWIFYDDWFRGGTCILLGALFWAVGYLYNRIQNHSYIIQAVEEYLADKTNRRKRK